MKHARRLENAFGPPVRDIRCPVFPAYEEEVTANGIPVYILKGGTQPVVKLELIFAAGKRFERKPGLARTVADLLLEGSTDHTAAQIAEFFDAYGATVQSRAGVDMGRVTLYCMTKHIGVVVPFLFSSILKPAFLRDELDLYVANQAQYLQIELAKNSVLADHALSEHLFGAHHPYGYNRNRTHLEKLTIQDLRSHHKRCYLSRPLFTIISGMINDQALTDIMEALNQMIFPESLPEAHIPHVFLKKGKFVITGKTHYQSSVRYGMRTFGRMHPDYPELSILMTILGGYFGSRLVKNIREQKGYTYHIYASLDAFVHDGCFYISSEVAHGKSADTFQEIEREFARLREEPVSREELRMVRNYLSGTLLSQLDGPFQIADILKTLILESHGTAYYTRLIEAIATTSPKRLQDLARQYLVPEKMIRILVR